MEKYEMWNRLSPQINDSTREDKAVSSEYKHKEVENVLSGTCPLVNYARNRARGEHFDKKILLLCRFQRSC